MYPLTPSRVYVLDRVMQDPMCVARMERILEALASRPQVIRITEGNLPQVVEELNTLWPPEDVPPGGCVEHDVRSGGSGL